MSRPLAMVYVTVAYSQQVAADNAMAIDILKHYARLAIESIPETAYAVENRVVRCGAKGPWDLWDIAKGGSHADPLSQDVYSVRLITYNLVSLNPPELRYAQSIINNVPEGSLLPSDFAAYFPDDIAAPSFKKRGPIWTDQAALQR